jgi:hypothetical protein
MGQFLKKMSYRIFFNIPFWTAPRVPNNIHRGLPDPQSLENSSKKRGVYFQLFEDIKIFGQKGIVLAHSEIFISVI